MELQRTFALIKTHAVANQDSGDIISLIERNGFEIIEMYKMELEAEQAKVFYQEHSEKSFFPELVDNITVGPVIVMMLERENAVAAWRDLMGATDPEEATLGSLRAMFGEHIGANAVHGSDAPETAEREMDLFFGGLTLLDEEGLEEDLDCDDCESCDESEDS